MRPCFLRLFTMVFIGAAVSGAPVAGPSGPLDSFPAPIATLPGPVQGSPASGPTGTPASATPVPPAAILSEISTTLSPSEWVQLTEAAAALKNEYEILENTRRIEVAPLEIAYSPSFLSSSGGDGASMGNIPAGGGRPRDVGFDDVLEGDELGGQIVAGGDDHCFDASTYEDVLADLFEVLTQQIGFAKREARTFIRQLYLMPVGGTIGYVGDGPNMRCFTEVNYRDISDLLVTLGKKVGAGDKFSIPRKNGTPVAPATSTDSTLPSAVRPVQNRNKCPYQYKKCCTFYNIPGVSDPQQRYIDCCFNAFYAQINADWEDYYADLYSFMSPAEFTLLYCVM